MFYLKRKWLHCLFLVCKGLLTIKTDTKMTQSMHKSRHTSMIFFFINTCISVHFFWQTINCAHKDFRKLCQIATSTGLHEFILPSCYAIPKHKKFYKIKKITNNNVFSDTHIVKFTVL